MVHDVLRDCIGMRLRVYSRDEGCVVKAFDEVLTGVRVTSPEHVLIIKEGPFRIKKGNRLVSGNTLRTDELVLKYKSSTLVTLVWRGHTRFCLTPH